MAIKLKSGGYACAYCKKEYSGRNGLQDAENCKDSHQLIYLAISKEDLQKLIMFIYSKDDSILGENIVERLQSYTRGAFELDLTKEKN